MSRQTWHGLWAWCHQSVACFLAFLLAFVLVPAPPAHAAIGAVWNGSKTVVPSIAAAGSTVTYTVTVSNQGDDKDHVTVTDTLPAGFTYLASGALPAGTTTVARYENTNGTSGPLTGSGTVTPTRTVVGGREQLAYPQVNNFQPGWVYIYTIKVNIPSGTPDGAYGNDLYIDGQAGGINRDVDLQDTAIVTIGEPPVLEVSKTTSPAGPVTIAENSTILYQIMVKNTGGGTATSLSVVDTLPATFTYDATYPSTYSLNGGAATNITPTVAGTTVTWNYGNLAGNNSTLVITFRALSGTGAASHGTWNNQVLARASNAVDANTGPTAPVTVVDTITPTVTKAITAANQAGPPYDGTTGNLELTYTITITNPSSATAQNLQVTDDLPGTTGWVYKAGSSNKGNPNVVGNQLVWNNIGNLGPGASTTVTFTLHAPSNQSGTFNDTVTVTGTNTASVTTGPTAPAALKGPAYSVTKTASISTGALSTNNDFIYTVEVTNTGTANGTYRLTDVLPDDTVMIDWSGGATRVEYDSNIAGGAAVVVSNTAPTGYPGPTLTFPTATTSYTIAPGITDRIRFRARLNTAVAGTYYNRATVSDVNFISSGTTGLTAPVTVGTPPSLSIAKSVDQSLVLPLDSVVYTVHVANNASSATAYNVDVTDTLPTGFNYQPSTSQVSVNGGAYSNIGNPAGTFGTITWNNIVASLAAGQYVDLRFTVQVSNTAGSYDNQASTFGDNYGNINTGPTATVVVGNPPTLQITKTDSRGGTPITLGTQADVDYTISVHNVGSLAANSITITDTLPTGTSYLVGTSQLSINGGAFGATGDPSGTTGTVTWPGLPSIPAGGTMSLKLTVRFPNTMTSGTYPNYASASGSNVSLVSTGPTAPVTVGNPPAVSISSAILGATSVTAPSNVQYRITISNAAGAGTAQLALVNAILPLGMNYLAGSTSWTGAGASPPLSPTLTGTDPMTVQWSFATPISIAPGGSVTLTYTAQVLASAVAANAAGQGYYVESQTIGTNYGLITTGIPPGSPTAGSSSPPALQVTSSSSVGLTNLIAIAKPIGVDLHWQTSTEWHDMGFTVSRSDRRNGPYTSLTTTPITGLGSSAIGGTYHFTDTGITPGQTYYYQLEATEFGGLIQHYGPLKVQVPTSGEVQASLENGPNPPAVPTAVPTTPAMPHTADTQRYLQVAAVDDTGITLRLVTPTVQLHTVNGQTQAIIEHLPLVYAEGQYRVPEAVVPLGLPADIPYTVTVVNAADPISVADVLLPEVSYTGSGNVTPSASATPPAVTSSADPVTAIVEPPATTTATSGGGTTSTTTNALSMQFAFGVLNTATPASQLVDTTESAQAGNHRVLQLKLYPVQYDRSRMTLTQYRDLTVRLAFARPAHPVTATTERNLFDQAFDQLVGEYDLLARWESPLTPLPDTHASFGGPAYRITVPQEGLYQLTAADLLAAGMNLAQPEKLRLFYRDRELPLEIVGDGTSVSAIRFFAPANTTIYSRETVLFLVQDQVDGRRIGTFDGTPQETLPTPAAYAVSETHDPAGYFWRQMPNDGESDYWFMDYLDLAFDNKPTVETTFHLQGVAAASDQPNWIEVGLRGEVKEPKVPLNNHVAVAINGREVGQVLWSGTDYVRRKLPIAPGDLIDGDNTVTLTVLTDRGARTPVALVDSVTVHYWRPWTARDGKLDVTLSDPAAGTYAATGFSSPVAGVYDVTDPADVRKATGITSNGGNLTFADPASAGDRRYWIGDETALGHAAIQAVTDTDALHPAQQADYLVITPAAFRQEAERLANFRAQQGLHTRVVDVQTIYDEFAGGHAEPEAIKAFLAWTQHNWQAPAPAYVVLMGDGSFDYRNDYGDDPATLTQFIPPHLRASLHIGLTPDDNWYASVIGDDDLPDLFIGRLPAASAAEAATMVDKIIAFEQSHRNGLQQAVSVSDNNEPVFAQFTQEIRSRYASSFNWLDLGMGDRAGLAQALDDGAELTFYMGHGSTELWGDEQVLANDQVDSLQATDKAAVVVAGSCLTAYFYDAYLPSLGETLLRSPQKGAAAYLGSSGYTLPESQAIMLRRFFRFSVDQGMSLGAAMTLGKIGMFMDDAPLWHEEMSSWVLLGDPAMGLRPQPAAQ